MSGQNVPRRTEVGLLLRRYIESTHFSSARPMNVEGGGTSPTPPNRQNLPLGRRVSATKGAVNAVHLWNSLLTQQLNSSESEFLPPFFFCFSLLDICEHHSVAHIVSDILYTSSLSRPSELPFTALMKCMLYLLHFTEWFGNLMIYLY